MVMKLKMYKEDEKDKKVNTKNIPASLKLLNRKVVYNMIAKEAGMSRADIARKTGISGATVIRIVEYLMSKDIVIYDALENIIQPGRKPTPLRFNSDFAYIIAVYMEGFYASMGILNTSGMVKFSTEFKIPDFARFMKMDFYNQIDYLIKASGIDRKKLIGIGMAIPAAFDSKTHQVYRTPLSHAFWLSNLETLVSKLGSRYKVPVFVENDVNAAAYGEYRSAYSETTSSLIYVSLGSGLGGGIILNGKLWKGQSASAGELGYLILDTPENGLKDSGMLPENTGWLENRTDLVALKEKFGFDIQSLTKVMNEKQIVDYLSKYLALAVFNINAVLDIKTVVLGGVLADHFAEILVEKTRQKLERSSQFAPLVVSGKIKNPSFVGLSYIVMDELLDGILSY